MIEVILAEDHQAVRETLRLLLESQPDFHVMAEAGEGWDVLQHVRKGLVAARASGDLCRVATHY